MGVVSLIWNYYILAVGYGGGGLILIFVVFAIVAYLRYQYTCVHCPDCRGMKFHIMIGGPPKCVKCGWQNSALPFESPPPLPKRYNRYHYVD